MLRRESLSIVFHIYRFVELFEDQCVAWWPSVRYAVYAMAAITPHLISDVGAPVASTVFASDASGGNDRDVADHG